MVPSLCTLPKSILSQSATHETVEQIANIMKKYPVGTMLITSLYWFFGGKC